MAENIFSDIMYKDVLVSDGFIVDYMVCTTYSLDMPTLLSVPFMLGTQSEITEETLRSPHYLLVSINRSAEKFVVFCNSGSIAVPQNLNIKIYSLLEKNVVQIALGSKGRGFVNFHPKIWVIKETNPDTQECQIKVVVMSRNLTSSNDLDIVCELTGTVGKNKVSGKQASKNKPLTDFLWWLRERVQDTSAKKHIRQNIKELINCIEHVKRFNLDKRFEDYDFYPMGISGSGYEYNGRDICQKAMLDHAAKTIIISPFIDVKTLRRLFTSSLPSKWKTLITRHNSVSDEILSMMNDNVYAVKEVMTDMAEKEIAVDIHEKVYFIYNGKTRYNYLYLGSANATRNAFCRNVEFMVRLRFMPYKMSYDKFRRELIFDGKECMFEQVTGVPEKGEEAKTAEAEHLIREAIEAVREAKIVLSAKGRYTITIVCDKNLPSESIYIYPLYSLSMKKKLKDGVTFENIPLASLTEFYVLEVKGDEEKKIRRVIKVNTPDMPTDDRDKAIFQSIIDTKAKYISCINFMIADSPETFIAENGQLEREFSSRQNAAKEQEISTSLFEDMMRVAYKDPDRIKSIREIMEKMDKDDSLSQMCVQFEKVLKRIKKL
ncbi:MAG: phospholipase D family protein [Prevotella sp.]|nr:phospholipase D family protein [Prevotella sp.]